MKLLHFVFLLAAAAEMSVPAWLGAPMLKTELERGIALADVAASTESLFYSQAEEVYGKVNKLLPNISGLSRDERAVLTARVTDLRMALELVPPNRKPPLLFAR